MSCGAGATAANERAGGQRGSVMFLYPVGVVIVLILGAIAVDLSNVWLQQRRLADAADSAANDAVSYGLDQDVLRAEGTIDLDADRVLAAVDASVSGHGLPAQASVSGIDLAVNAAGNPTVQVTIDSTAELIFGRIVRSGGVAISATGVAELTDGP